MILRHLIVLFVIIFIIGCTESDSPTGVHIDDDPNNFVVLRAENTKLPEDSYHVSRLVSLGSGADIDSGFFELSFNLKSWPEHYGLEYFVMEDAEYNKFQEGKNYEVKSHKTIKLRGLYTDSTAMFIGGDYRVLIDNTNAGWERTDSDSSSDDATYDVTVWLR